MGGAVGYHTSVLVNGTEYYFSTAGITESEKIVSHGRRAKPDRIFFGFSQYSGREMAEFLRRFFRPGSYDILRKNCNSFSDCALFHLTGQRLAWNLRAAERVGVVADDSTGLVQVISGGSYVPNARAMGFDVERVIEAIAAHLGTRDSDDESDSDSSRATSATIRRGEADWDCSTAGSDEEEDEEVQRTAVDAAVARSSCCAAAFGMKLLDDGLHRLQYTQHGPAAVPVAVAAASASLGARHVLMGQRGGEPIWL